METQGTIHAHLARHLAERKVVDPTYSLRKMGKELGQNPAALCQILQGRNVSLKLSRVLAERLGLSPKDIAELSKGPRTQKLLSSLGRGRDSLDLAHYEVVSEWHYFAIRSLARTRGFLPDPAWIAKRLGIPVGRAEKALERLKALGLLELDTRGRMRTSAKGLVTTDGLRNLALRRRHQANLEGARQSLLGTPVDQRDFTFMTMAIDPTRLPEARKRVRRFLNRLCDYLEGGWQTEVYETCVQIFPRTQLDSEKETLQ